MTIEIHTLEEFYKKYPKKPKQMWFITLNYKSFVKSEYYNLKNKIYLFNLDKNYIIEVDDYKDLEEAWKLATKIHLGGIKQYFDYKDIELHIFSIINWED